MCGIFGILTKEFNKISPDYLFSAIDTLGKRGPDNKDIWISNNQKYGLGHTRLSIQDLSTNGSQPMFDKEKKIGIVFNGEIYNHKKIRSLDKFLNNIYWHSNSDTETILNLYKKYGIDHSVDQLNGMFAFAIIDLNRNKVFLCRDRIGEKPLYYYQDENIFIFCSDLTFINSINSNNQIDRLAIFELINKGYISSPKSIYKNVKKVLPANIIEIDLENFSLNSKQYWSSKKVFKNNYNKYNGSSEKELLTLLDNKITNVIEEHLISDVEVGSLLSGGIDSSLITSYVSKINSKKIKTFTVGFENINYDESNIAREVSKYLKTDHKEVLINTNDCIDAVEKLNKIYSEPFADSSQIPTFVVSKYASQYVKVVLTGDGGDELFGGYNRYILVKKILSNSNFVKQSLKKIINLFSYNSWNNIFTAINYFNKNNNVVSQPADKIFKVLDILNCINEKEAYFKLTRSSSLVNNLLLDIKILDNYQDEWNDKDLNFLEHECEKMMLTDMESYLTDDVLCKVDRASMYNSLETRHPFLDKEVIEESAKIPLKYKIKKNSGKYILKKLLYSKVPDKIFNKNKTGFAFPVDDLLRGPLYDWSNDLLDYNLIKNQGFFDPKIVNRIKKNHFSKKENFSKEIWSLLMFQSWYLNK